ARHFAKAHERSRFVEERRDHDVGPEARSVFADTPSFVLEAALAGGYLELPRGLAPRDIFGGVENREVATDDLVSAVPLETLGTLVPTQDVAGSVEDEDGVIHHALD